MHKIELVKAHFLLKRFLPNEIVRIGILLQYRFECNVQINIHVAFQIGEQVAESKQRKP